MKKLYWAIIVGKLDKRGGMIRAPLTKKKKVEGEESEMVTLADPHSTEPSEEAATQYKVIERIGNTDAGYVRSIPTETHFYSSPLLLCRP